MHSASHFQTKLLPREQTSKVSVGFDNIDTYSDRRKVNLQVGTFLQILGKENPLVQILHIYNTIENRFPL